MTNSLTYAELYSEKANDLTLAQGLELHYRLNPQFTRWDQYPKPILQQAMKSHDIAHVVFGCDTQLLGEMRIEIWTLLGTQLKFNEYLAYVSNPDVINLPLKILKELGMWKSLKFFTRNAKEFFRIFMLSRTLSKKWAVFNEEEYLNKTIGQIRKEFNIPLIGPSA